MVDASALAVYDHVRAPETGVGTADVTAGIYRVVGAGDSSVTLLRVGDADGHRVNTGDVVTVARDDLDGFEPADNPDGNRSAAETASRFLVDLRWQLQTFAGGLRARPLAALAAFALVIVGHQGHRVLSVPESVLTAVYFLGVLGVVYVGSRGG